MNMNMNMNMNNTARNGISCKKSLNGNEYQNQNISNNNIRSNYQLQIQSTVKKENPNSKNNSK